MTFPIPDRAIASHTAIIGKTGSGKTSTSKLIIERIVDQGYRVCILDPIKSDWWGITSSADGKKPGLPFQILGGPKGALALPETAGAAIGKLVGSGKLPLSILDMADFGPGGLQAFFNDFAPALLRSMKGVLYLVVEEAHEFAPKERPGISKGNENISIHFAKKLATAGRSRGIRLIAATQSVQSLHNAVLGSCETLIAHRITLPAQQKPVKDWLSTNADKASMERVAASLASLKTGTGWVCAGEAGVFDKVSFPKYRTYDNTAAPTKNSGDHDVAMAPVDIGALEKLLGKAAEEAKANDPKMLKDEIAKLKKELAAKPKPTGLEGKTLGDLARIETEAEKRGYQRGAEDMRRNLNALAAAQRERLENVAALHSCEISAFVNAPIECAAEAEDIKLQSKAERQKALKKLAAALNPERPAAVSTVNGDLTPALQKVIDAIAWWRTAGFEKVRRAHASVVAGYSPRASTFHGYVAKLAAMGLVDTADGAVALTPEGLALANQVAAATDEDLADMVRSLLKPQQIRVFEAVRNVWPDSITRADIAEAVGLSARASTVHGYIAAVAAYGVIETGAGTVKAADWLFPEAR